MSDLPECFGDQGGVVLSGDSPKACLGCVVFDSCNKITVAGTLQAIANDLLLIVQSGIKHGTLEPMDMGEDPGPEPAK